MRRWFAECLDVPLNRLPRLLTLVLVAAAILAAPISYATVPSASLPHQPLKHLPSKQVGKARTILPSSARSSSTSSSEIRLRSAQGRAVLSTHAFSAGQPANFTGVHRVIRPLRC